MVRINSVPSQNGAQANGHDDGENGVISTRPSRQQTQFDKPVILRQAPHWSRAVVWGIVGVTVASIGWACLAKFEEAVPAQGKLEPKGVVQPVKAPVGGVIDEVFVNEGEAVEVGDTLVTFDPQSTRAQMTSLEEIRKKLNEENSFYQAQLANQTAVAPTVEIAPGIAQLTSNRAALVAENNLYRAQLAGDLTGETLSPDQRARLRTATEEINSRLSIAGLERDQLERQLSQTRVQLANARDDLRVNQDILERVKPLADRGAIGEIPYLQQEQEVKNRQT